MTTHRRRVLFIIILLSLALTLACGTVERSQSWAHAEQTRRVWAVREYVPIMETAIP